MPSDSAWRPFFVACRAAIQSRMQRSYGTPYPKVLELHFIMNYDD